MYGNFKQKTFRSKKFIRWVASLPCMKCKIHGRTQSAHLAQGGKGIKGCDKSVRPLCTVGADGRLGCHEKLDQHLDIRYWRENKSAAIELPIYDLWERGEFDEAAYLLERF